MDIGAIVARQLFGNADIARTERSSSVPAFPRHMERAMRPEAVDSGRRPVFTLRREGEEGDSLVGAWATRDGASVSVFRPDGFDPAHPVFRVRTWDADGAAADRMVDVAAVNPRAADALEMYALSGAADGGDFDMQGAFMMLQSMRESFGMPGDADAEIDWIALANEAMYAHRGAGDMRGYERARGFLDALLARTGNA